MKRGLYVVGDPYLFFDTSGGIKKLDNLILRQKGLCVKFIGNRVPVDNEGMKYWITSGWFGIIPVSLLRVDAIYSSYDIPEMKGMRLLKFQYNFTPVVSDSEMIFGGLKIKL